MKKKKFLTLALSAVLLFASVGCGEKIEYPNGAPELNSGKKMFIGAFCSPEPSDEAYKLVGESGITHMVTYPDNDKQPAYSPKFYKDPFDFGAKYGVTIVPNTQNQAWTAYSKYNKTWKGYSNYGGMNVFDEPSVKDFALLKKNLATYKEQVPEMPYYINLFPNYANADQLGVSTYEEYVKTFTEELLAEMDEGNRYMICDIYPLLKQSQMYGRWLNNLEVLRKYADTVDAELYIYIQSIGFSNRRQPAGASDLRMQAYVSMAYGSTGIYHFTYQTPYWDSMYTYNYGLVDNDGVPTVVYDYAKEVNTELHKLEDAYLDFDWKGVIASIGTENLVGENVNFSNCSEFVENYGVLTEVQSQQDAIVGCFENEEGYQGYMAVNFTDPTLKKTNEVTLTFQGGVTKAIVYTAGEPKTVELTDGKYTFTLSAGEGNFVVPFKG